MDTYRSMYQSRRMTLEQRNAAVKARQLLKRPWHGPPHLVGAEGIFLITAACFEHRPFIGISPNRMADFESKLLNNVDSLSKQIFAWVVLPNHYHVLVHTEDITSLLQSLGRFHGRTAYQWNGEEQCRGRQVWYRSAETSMKSEGHFWATLNYVLNNAVRHGYVDRWQEWPFSNAAEYLEEVGHEEAKRRWREYPLREYGKDWDQPEM